MIELTNVTKDYAWGSQTMIPELLGEKPTGKPQAEVWIGAHPDAPSTSDGEGLDKILKENPKLLEGPKLELAKLPYLMKILAADSALSLQVHPSKKQAVKGFEKEEKEGVPQDAPNRNYKDDNHKPEMIYALTDFEALNGFRQVDQIKDIFDELVYADDTDALEESEIYQEFYKRLNSSDSLYEAFNYLVEKPAGIENFVATVVDAAAESSSDEYEKEFATVQDLQELYPGDPGVVISLMLNRASLKPGEAMYTEAGVVHAYLHGLGIEVMASSDNVLRAGLTPKYMDVPELMQIAKFDSEDLPLLPASEDEYGDVVLQPPFEEFQLQVIELDEGQSATLVQNGPTILLVTQGNVDVESPYETKELTASGCVFIAQEETPVAIKANEKSQAFGVTVNTAS